MKADYRDGILHKENKVQWPNLIKLSNTGLSFRTMLTMSVGAGGWGVI